MELEVIQLSVWSVVTAILIFVAMAIQAIGLAQLFISGWKLKISLSVVIAGSVLFFGAVSANAAISNDRIAQMESSFSQQLEDKYDATSSRPLEDMRKDFYKYNEAATVFTRNGEQTTVFVKKIGDDDKKLTMVFTVVDEKALYPKAK